MGTSIKIQAFKGEKTPNDKWEEFKTLFYSLYDDVDDQDDCIEAPCVYCSYSQAYLNVQMVDFEKFKGLGIEFNLYYLERDPDETKEL